MESPADTTWKGYSVAERDRRWNAVRDNAAKGGFDCIFVPLCVDPRNLYLSLESSHGVRSDCRYLTEMENAVIVLPTDGRTPIVINDRGRGNEWITDARSPGRGMRASWAGAMADALVELGMDRARIGVSGLQRGKVTHGRAIEGVVNHTSYAEVLRRLPNATFEDATDVVGFARYVKGNEEIDCLRRGATIAAAGIETMVNVARPGVDAKRLYARVMGRMLELGSEYYNLALYVSPLGQPSFRYQDPPLDRTLQPGDYIHNETDAVWGGLIAQEMQPILLGPVPDDLQRVVDLQRDVFQAGLERMKAGQVFGDFIDFVNGFGAKRGMRTLTLMHGRGYGNDGPLLTPQERGDYFRDVVMEKGNCWVWKPIASTADESTSYEWGGVTVVTETGGEMLTGRIPGLVSIQ